MDALDYTDPTNMILNGKPFRIPRGFSWVSPVKTDYYANQCATCTGWARGTINDECSVCVAVTLQKTWLKTHRRRYSEEVLREMVAAYRAECETGKPGFVKDWAQKYVVDLEATNRV